MGPDSLDASLVRIRTVDGGIVGAGFLVGECQVLTCAHVVAQAVGLTEAPADPPLETVVLDFPLLAPRTRLAAKVVFWCPVKDDGSGDIASLELLGDPPAGAQMVRFTSAEDVWEHPFRAFGFPARQDDGVWATGRLLGRQATGWLLLEDVKTEGFAVMPGFSGGPVWDTQLQGVVGMVVASSRSTETKTAFVIPFDVLAKAWPRLQPITHQRVFLSAAPTDMAFAERLRADLQAQGVVVWDELHGPAGTDTDAQERVRQAIRAAQAVLLVVSSQTRTSRTVKEHLRLADLYQRRLVLAWVGDDKHMQPQFDGWQDTVWIDAQSAPYEMALRHIEAALSQSRSRTLLLEPSWGAPEQAPRNPYKGLRPFTADDVGDFFGRERLVNDLVNDVATLLAAPSPNTESGRCLMIIGPSGSGKSSVIMAGLLPRLQHGAVPGSDTWVYLEPMVPGKHPLEALTLILKPHFPDSSFKTLREDLEDDAACGLHLLATQLVKERGSRVVLLVDQFEEVFTQTETEDERQRFLDLLLTAATTPCGPLFVLLTLRADFYDRPMQYPSLSRLIQAHQQQVLPMEVEDLRATVEQPAALPDVQLAFEGNLVGDLLFEMRGQVGGLPLLQFTLDQLFERCDGRRLTLQAYHEIGGVKGALSQHAEQVYAALPSEEHRRLAQALFLRLIEPGASEQDTTRRRAARSEFTFDDPTQTRLMRETIDAFIAARLLMANEVAGTTTLEVSHEAVLREWKRVAGWLNEARGDIHIQRSLSKDVAEWEQHKRPGDRLYRGTKLEEAQGWAGRNKPSEQEAVFLRASVTRRIQSFMGVIVMILLLLTSTGIAGWFVLTLPPSPKLVTTLQDYGPGSLRYCINNALSGSTITFAKGLRGTIRLTGGDLVFVGDKQLTITGPGANLVIITNRTINGGNTNASIRVSQKAILTISGLSFRESVTTHDAFIVNRGTLTMTDSIISDNQGGANSNVISFAGDGGGIYNDSSGTLTVINSSISDNQTNGIFASTGGGINNAGKFRVIHSTISNNITRSDQGLSYGGGIYNGSLGKLFMTNSTVIDNTADSGNYSGQGGGIANNGTITITNSIISRNKARDHGSQAFSYGGGIVNGSGGNLSVINSTISNNSVHSGSHTGGGGGIASGGGGASTLLRFCTIAYNTADEGGGIQTDLTDRDHLTMSSSIIAANSAHNGPDISGALTSDGYDLLTNVAGATGLNRIDRQVTLADLKINPTLGNNGGFTQTLALQPGSPAIDVVPSNACSITVTDVSGHTIAITTDERGDPRPDGSEGNCDIGAYESLY